MTSDNNKLDVYVAQALMDAFKAGSVDKFMEAMFQIDVSFAGHHVKKADLQAHMAFVSDPAVREERRAKKAAHRQAVRSRISWPATPGYVCHMHNVDPEDVSVLRDRVKYLARKHGLSARVHSRDGDLYYGFWAKGQAPPHHDPHDRHNSPTWATANPKEDT